MLLQTFVVESLREEIIAETSVGRIEVHEIFICSDRCNVDSMGIPGLFYFVLKLESPESSRRIFLSGFYVPRSQWG